MKWDAIAVIAIFLSIATCEGLDRYYAHVERMAKCAEAPKP